VLKSRGHLVENSRKFSGVPPACLVKFRGCQRPESPACDPGDDFEIHYAVRAKWRQRYPGTNLHRFKDLHADTARFWPLVPL